MNNYKVIVDNINFNIEINKRHNTIGVSPGTILIVEIYQYDLVKNGCSAIFTDRMFPKEVIDFIERIIALEIFT